MVVVCFRTRSLRSSSRRLRISNIGSNLRSLRSSSRSSLHISSLRSSFNSVVIVL